MDSCLKICWILLELLLQYYTISLQNENRIKVSITATSKVFGTQEKPLHQALEGVHYESGSQKCRWQDAAHDKQEDSSSSEVTNDDHDEEGAVARINCSKRSTRSNMRPLMKSENMWHQSQFIITVFPPGPLHPPVPYHIPNFQIFLSRLPFNIFKPSCQN